MALHPYLSTIRRNLPLAARQMGFQARVTSGYRSTKKQAELYRKYQAGLMPYAVAPPGTSSHEKGLALDVVSTDTNKLLSLLTSAGLSWAGPDDPVHFQLTGLKSQAKPKKKESLIGEILDWTSWIPGPIGWASMGLDIFL